MAGDDVVHVPVSEEWLVEHEVQPWFGPKSLPLWLPAEDAGLNTSSMALVESLGLKRRPLAETLADTLAWREQHPELAAQGRADGCRGSSSCSRLYRFRYASPSAALLNPRFGGHTLLS